MFFLVDFPLHLCYTSPDNEEMNASEDPVLRSENPSSEPNASEDSSDSERCSEDLVNDVNDLCSCLLYTSPSPRDATLSRMPSSA